MRAMKRISLLAIWLAPVLAPFLVSAALAADARPGLKPCRLQGIEHEALCGVLQRPLEIGRAHV